MGFHPRCFGSRHDYGLWLAAARRRDPGKSGYCADCTPDYQRQMIDGLRCAHPGTTFYVDEDGMVCGRRPGNTAGRRR